jgi:hypothetical protein
MGLVQPVRDRVEFSALQPEIRALTREDGSIFFTFRGHCHGISRESASYAADMTGIVPLISAQVCHEDAARLQPIQAIPIEVRRTELRRLPLLVEAVHKDDIGSRLVGTYKIRSIRADDAEALVIRAPG